MISTVPPLPAPRHELLQRLAEPRTWDLAVIGGGATGLGVALDAAARGFSVVLMESHDFAEGTSSRATKLVHGGVRYLAQGNLSLVREALTERAHLLRNAPHLVAPLAFVMPTYRWWERLWFGAGLRVYDLMAGRAGLGRTESLSAQETLRALPNAQRKGLTGGVRYWDGQFDDARLAVALARTAATQGALLVNHCAVTGLLHGDEPEAIGQGGPRPISGLEVRERFSGQTFALRARCVVNATGVWVDGVRQMDAPATDLQPMVTPSQGVHLVVDQTFWPGPQALLVPRTQDGRVLFAVPWLGKVILGTTDTPRADAPREPSALSNEVDFILREASRYLARAPQRSDVLSVWVGLRPLVRPDAHATSTGGISREHTVRVSPSQLVTVTGGKWTTYRAMAEDVLDVCMARGLLPRRPAGVTAGLALVGAAPTQGDRPQLWAAPGPHLYGSEAGWVADMAATQPDCARPGVSGISPRLPPNVFGLTDAMVRFAVRYEYALTVSDVLARRSRALFLDAKLASGLAPAVAELMVEEGVRTPSLEAFLTQCEAYARCPA